MSIFNEDSPIWISTTQGEKIEVQNVLIGLPKQPQKSEILFHDLPTKQQKWKPTEQPKGLKKHTIDQYADFIELEIDRIRNGVWFYSNGVPKYITGLYYYYLTYIKIDIGYPEYRDRDRIFFYFWEASLKYEECAGVTLVKPRRWGATWIGTAMLLYYGSQVRDGLLGILSKTGKDAQSMFTRKVVSSFRKLPFWLQPTSASGSNPKTSLEFTESTRRGKNTEDGIEESDALNTMIEWRNTTENSFDSEKLYLLVADEFGKLSKDIRLETLWEVVSKCLYVGITIKGRVFMPSTVNDLDAGGAQFKALYDGSEIEKMEYGKTPTGMWAYFVPAYDGLEGCIDEYGNSIIEDPIEPTFDNYGKQITHGSKTLLTRDRNRKKQISKTAYLENIRQFPFTKQEAFYFNANTAVLDVQKITQQINYELNERIDKPARRGNFVWIEKGKEVAWIPSENGKFLASWIPPKDMQNQFFTKAGRKCPANAMYGAFGLDPYEVSVTNDNRGSEQGFHGHTKNVIGGRNEVPNYKCFLEYIDRRDTVEGAFEDALMAAFFYGMPILFENNKYSFARYAEAQGLEEYVMPRPKNTYPQDTRYNASIEKKRGFPSNKDTNETHAQLMQVYVSKYMGEDDDEGTVGDFPFIKTLQQLAVFNLEDRGKLDGAVSFGIALIAVGDAPVDITEKKLNLHPLIQKGKITINY